MPEFDVFMFSRRDFLIKELTVNVKGSDITVGLSNLQG